MSKGNYFYAVRIRNKGQPAFLARQHPSAPALFWFHEDALEHRRQCEIGDGATLDIVKVLVCWSEKGKTYNTPGNTFRSAKELKKK